MLRVDVSKRFGEFAVEAAFASEGRVTGLFGASGAGKTSLINMIAGLLRPDRGVIAIDGETLDDTSARTHVAAYRRRIGYVFQDARLFPHLDVRDNLDYGRRMNRLTGMPRNGGASLSFWISAICWIVVPENYPAASASAWRSDGRCCRSRDCCSWMSRSDRSTRSARKKSCPIWFACVTKRESRWSMSATIHPRCGN